MVAKQQHVKFLHIPTRQGVYEWVRNARESINGLLRGGPFPYLWRDNIMDLTTARRGDGSKQPAFGAFRNTVGSLRFDADTEQEAFIAFHVDHDYALGTKLYPHMHWSADTASTNTVRWGFEFTLAKGHGQGVFPTSTTIHIEQAFAGVAFTHMIAEVSDADAIDGEALGIEPDVVIMMRVFRDATHVNDDLATHAFGLFVDLHYQAERRGTVNKAPDFFKAGG